MMKKAYADCDENDVVRMQEKVLDLGKAYHVAEMFKKK